jgi:hypothetical protein
MWMLSNCRQRPRWSPAPAGVALSGAGASVMGVARDRARQAELRGLLGDGFTPVVADAADPVAAGQLIDRYPRASWC